MIKVAVCGAMGKMGRNVLELLAEDGEAEAFCGIDPRAEGTINGVKVFKTFAEIEGKPDVIIDFSSPTVLDDELSYAVGNGVPAVIGSTGFTPEQLEKIDEASNRVAIFRTANFSLGVNLLCKLVKQASEVLGEQFDIEIIERHHNKKADAPSGTAIMLADSVNEGLEDDRRILNGRSGLVGKRGNEIGMHAVRGGTVVGEHEVGFYGEDEIVTLSHSARSKRVFASGAITACKWLYGKPAGKYDMSAVLDF